MRVKLRYKESLKHNITAVLIRGKTPDIWLREINLWNISLSQLECYLIPEANNISVIHGLFVIFADKNNTNKIKSLEPYTLLADKLYLPVNTELVPTINPEELKELLTDNIHVFHPVIGLIALKNSDKLVLSNLISLPSENTNNWGLAHSGILPKPKLTKIDIIQPTANDIYKMITEAINNKPLSEIPDTNKNTTKPEYNLSNKVSAAVLKGMLMIMTTFFIIMEKLFSNKNTGQNNSSTKNVEPGIFERFENWLKENLAELEKKRDDEIKRLLNLFDNDTDEALKYAIPLNSPYQNRGNAAPSDKLSQHSTTFSLKMLGGGGRVDSWNIDEHYYELRNKYLKAAEKEIAAKNTKKAAYIYANLLGDFSAAANVLEQGKLYREAAILYKDHLKNPYAAANCLEKGGLLLEAIEIFKTLNNYEKVGDLSKKMNLNEQANIYYEKSVALLLTNSNYLSAATIISEKINDIDRAKQLLLEGWIKSNQSELCLKKYFDSIPVSELDDSVQEIYNKHTVEAKYNNFLNVLSYLNNSKVKKEFKPLNHESNLLEVSRDISYEIISKQADKGNYTNLHNLKMFVPDDKLIGSDCGRFINKNTNLVKNIKINEFYLDKSRNWFKAIAYQNDFIVFGKKNHMLQMVRGNWDGQFEYDSWNEVIDFSYPFNFIANPVYSENIILQNGKNSLKDKIFSPNKNFATTLYIRIPDYLNNYSKESAIKYNLSNVSNIIPFVAKDKEINLETEIIGIAINNHSEVVILKVVNQTITMQIYNMAGVLQKTIDCKINDNELIFLLENPITFSSEMIYNNGNYYTYKDNLLIIVSEDYTVEIIALTEKITMMKYFYDYSDFRIVLKTEKSFINVEIKEKIELDKFINQDIETIDMQFISANKLIISEKLKVYLYNFSNNKLSVIFNSDSPIIGVLPTNKRNKCAIVDNNGKITISDVF